MPRLLIDASAPDAAVIEAAAAAIRSGGVVMIPTDTLYGLAADPFQPEAVRRVFRLKGRMAEKGLPLIAADIEDVERALGVLPAAAHRLAARFWPGPLTMLVKAPATLCRDVTGGTATVGVRVPKHAVAVALCRAHGGPLTATSANISGQSPSAQPDEVAVALGEHVDVFLDAGPTPGGLPSTIVDMAGATVRLIRAGAIPWEMVDACLARDL